MHYNCTYCYRRFTSAEEKEDHELCGHICSICNQHDRSCSHRRQCLYCEREFADRGNLREHELFGHICDTCNQHDSDCECRRTLEQEILEQNYEHPPRQPQTYRFGEIEPSWFGPNGEFNPPQGGGWNGQESLVIF